MKQKFLLLSIALMAVVANAQNDWAGENSPIWVRQIVPAGETGLWIATDCGVVWYDRITGESSMLNVANVGIPEDNVLSLMCDGDDLWIGTKQSGVVVMNDDVVKTSYNYVNSNIINDQYFGAISKYDDKVYFGALHGVYILECDTISSLHTPHWELSAFNCFSSIAQDKYGQIWVGGTDASGANESLCYIDEVNGLIPVQVTNEINDMLFDDNNILWIASDRDGLVKYDGINITKYTQINSQLPTNHCYCIARDDDGFLWIGTDKGIICFDGEKFTLTEICLEDEECDFAFCMYIDGNKKWIGTRRNGLIVIEDGIMCRCPINNSPINSKYTYDANETGSPSSDLSDVTSIQCVTQESNGIQYIYDIYGRRLAKEPEHGIYIKNGKKIAK